MIFEVIIVGVFIMLLGSIFGKALRSLNPIYIGLGAFVFLVPVLIAGEGMGNETQKNLTYGFFVFGTFVGMYKDPRMLFRQISNIIILIGMKLKKAFIWVEEKREIRNQINQANEYLRNAEEIINNKKRQYDAEIQSDIDELNRRAEYLNSRAEELRQREKDFYKDQTENRSQDDSQSYAHQQREDELKRDAEDLQKRAEELQRRAEKLRQREEAFNGQQQGPNSSEFSFNGFSDGLNHQKLADAYKILSTNSNDSPAQHKTAFRKLMKKYHGDMMGDAPKELQKIAEEHAKRITGAFQTIKRHHGFK
jgi:DNA repair exonuclease SbcCD ATPase subunit